MAIDIRRGRKIFSGGVVQAARAESDEWGIYTTFADDKLLVVKKKLLSCWEDCGLLAEDIFTRLDDDENLYYIVALPDYPLYCIKDAPPPTTFNEALYFAEALEESRLLAGKNITEDALYFAELSRLLPTYENSEPLPAELVLGKWLTGGINISTNDFAKLHGATAWLSAAELTSVIKAAGLAPDLTEKNEKDLPSQNCGEKISKLPFVLPGRAELTRFFNDYIIDVIKKPELYARMGIDFPGAVLLCGAPGTGKTYAAKELVRYLGWHDFYIDSGTIGSRYIHETSKKTADIFAEAADNAPSVIIIDEMEAFLSHRSASGDHIHHTEEVGEFLRMLQSAKEKRVLVIAMTNLLDSIDSAVKRKGRFDHIIEVNLPDENEVAELLRHLTKKLPMAKDADIPTLATKLAGHSMADIDFAVKEAGRRTAKAGRAYIDGATFGEVVEELKEKANGERVVGFIARRD